MNESWNELEAKIAEISAKQKQGLSLSREEISLLCLWHYSQSQTRQEQNYA